MKWCRDNNIAAAASHFALLVAYNINIHIANSIAMSSNIQSQSSFEVIILLE